MAYKEPKTKADLLNAMLSIDFSGDLCDLAPGRDLRLQRMSRNKLKMSFASGNSFTLAIQKPRGDPKVKKPAIAIEKHPQPEAPAASTFIAPPPQRNGAKAKSRASPRTEG